MADFKKQGGSLTGREERYDGFEGEPRAVGSALKGGSSTTGTSSYGNTGLDNSGGTTGHHGVGTGLESSSHTTGDSSYGNTGLDSSRATTGHHSTGTGLDSSRHATGSSGYGNTGSSGYDNATTSAKKPSLM